jgi:hypothetical protein
MFARTGAMLLTISVTTSITCATGDQPQTMWLFPSAAVRARPAPNRFVERRSYDHPFQGQTTRGIQSQTLSPPECRQPRTSGQLVHSGGKPEGLHFASSENCCRPKVAPAPQTKSPIAAKSWFISESLLEKQRLDTAVVYRIIFSRLLRSVFAPKNTPASPLSRATY